MNDGVDLKRRRVLTATATVVGGIGAVFAAVPFVSSMQPSAKAQAAGAPVKVDISKLEPGQLLVVEWRGKPVWILQRTKEVLDDLLTQNDLLRDPNSEKSEQPAYCKNTNRSKKEDLLVAIGICTHLGCSPTYVPEKGDTPMVGWVGGFFCPCHGSRFDLAGRVYQGVPAPLNLVIPPYSFLDDNTLLIGEDGGTA